MPHLIDNYVPMYSTPFASMGNHALLTPQTGGSSSPVLDLTTLLPVGDRAFGMTANQRLHPNGWVYYTGVSAEGSHLRRREISTGTDELVRDFGVSIRIGGGEGDFGANRLPINNRDGSRIRIYDVVTDELWQRLLPGMDGAMLSPDGTQLCVSHADAWYLYEPQGASLVQVGPLGYGGGHADTGVLPDGRNCLVVTSSNWVNRPWGDLPWSGSELWMVAVPLISGWTSQDILDGRIIRQEWGVGGHYSCHGEKVCVSEYVASGPGKVVTTTTGAQDLTHSPSDPIETSPIIEMVAKIANVPNDYWSQPHAAWSAEGNRIYWGQSDGTTYSTHYANIQQLGGTTMSDMQNFRDAFSSALPTAIPAPETPYVPEVPPSAGSPEVLATMTVNGVVFKFDALGDLVNK